MPEPPVEETLRSASFLLDGFYYELRAKATGSQVEITISRWPQEKKPLARTLFREIMPLPSPTAQLLTAERLIRDLAGGEFDEPCSLDHNGNCQAHGWFGEGECPIPRAKRLLGS